MKKPLMLGIAALTAAAALTVYALQRDETREASVSSVTFVPVGPAVGESVATAAQATRLIVYKSQYCGCCGDWVNVMRAEGFTVDVREENDLSHIKSASGVTDDLASCHTSQIGGYVVEGHVPAADIRRLLRERPNIAGIAVPGMPAGSPGMQQGDQRDRYDVIAFTRDGRRSVYASY